MDRIYKNKYHQCYLHYHIAFFTNNNFPLVDQEVQFIKSYFKSVSSRHEFKIVEMEFNNSGVVLTINCQTTHFIPNLIKALKGGAARFLYKEFPDSKINHGSSLWDAKYFISTDKKQFDQMLENHSNTH
ncbi:transposase [Mesobacillus foraminis]|uniref:transposase n=1 Tax=Mesobacillus foraminis TaxID=279826 RepID=UPI001BEAB85F|nr:transposase [Mesobacillus foraminis]MBT2758812.1 transposase [Mesobacillus foraminis]